VIVSRSFQFGSTALSPEVARGAVTSGRSSAARRPAAPASHAPAAVPKNPRRLKAAIDRPLMEKLLLGRIVANSHRGRLCHGTGGSSKSI
jgi:hypothetical protein